MKTLDRYVIRSFLWSALMLMVAVLAFRVMADLFVNMDEFMEDKAPFLETVKHIATYYGYRSLMYFSELGGVVIVAAAAFTMAKMNHTNELTAMLASGVSLHRVIMPMVVASVILGGLVTIDREILIPRNSQYLIRDRDEARQVDQFPVYSTPDSMGNIWWSLCYDPNRDEAARVMSSPIIVVRNGPVPLASITSAQGARQGKFKPVGGGKIRGWVIEGGNLSRTARSETFWQNIPTVEKVYSNIGPDRLLDAAKRRAREAGQRPSDGNVPWVTGLPATIDRPYSMTITTRCPPDKTELALRDYVNRRPQGGTLTEPVFTYDTTVTNADGNSVRRVLGIFYASSATWVSAKEGKDADAAHWALEDGKLFFPSDLSHDDLTLRQSSRWLDLMSLKTISKLLKLGKVPDREAAVLTKHIRFAEPINNLIMLLLGLPFILSRERNIKASAGLSVLMTGAYFAFIHIARVAGLPPMLAAFLPIVLFGTVGAVMLDSIKT